MGLKLCLFFDSRQVVMLLSLIGLLQDEALNGFLWELDRFLNISRSCEVNGKAGYASVALMLWFGSF